MLLYRIGPEGFYAAGESPEAARLLYSDPFATYPSQWEFGRRVDIESEALLAPIVPGKIVGVGRNYRAHAAELGNPMPEEPLLFLKAPSSVVGPQAPIVLPPESARVEHEAEIAVVVRDHLCRADEEEAAASLLGITAACDITARDLQRRDATFARAKSFDTFCPLGPAILLAPLAAEVQIVCRLNGSEMQHGRSSEMAWGIPQLLAYISRMMTLEPGDVVLTGTPAGVGPLADGDLLEIELEGVGLLRNPVEAWRRG